MTGPFFPVDEALADDWGPWGLGDLADVTRHVAYLLGSATPVLRIAVDAPTENDDRPRITVFARDHEQFHGLWEHLAGDQTLPFPPIASGSDARSVEVDGIELRLVLTAEASPS